MIPKSEGLGPKEVFNTNGVRTALATPSALFMILHGPAVSAPEDQNVLVDSGPLGAGKYCVHVGFGSDDCLSAINIELVHRNAANTADVGNVVSIGYFTGAYLNTPARSEFFNLAVGERVLVRKRGASTAGSVYAVSLYLRSTK